jgi:hypothetical protein
VGNAFSCAASGVGADLDSGRAGVLYHLLRNISTMLAKITGVLRRFSRHRSTALKTGALSLFGCQVCTVTHDDFHHRNSPTTRAL